MITISQAIANLRPNEEWVMHNDDVENIIWHTPDLVGLTVSEINAEIEKLEKVQLTETFFIEQAKTAALAHARSLGFTDTMLAVMYPNLTP